MFDIKKNIRYLHIIRGLAALLVVVAHAKWPFWTGGTAYLEQHSFGELSLLDRLGFILAMATSNGTAMVIIFYVLSGFLISYSYEKNNWRYSEFLINRCIRIYIPFAASLVLAALMIVLAHKLNPSIFETGTGDFSQSVDMAYHQGFTLENLVKTIFFYRSDANYIGFNFVYWSLLYEGVFYLIFPLLFRYIRFFSILAVLAFPCHIIFDLPEMKYFYFYFLSKFLIYFCMGIWLFKLVTAREAKNLFRRKYVTLLLIPLLFLLVVALGLSKLKLISFLFAGILGITAIYYILQFGVRKNWFSGLLVMLGEISYSLYLIHIPLFILLYALAGLVTNNSVLTSPWTHYLFVAAVIPVSYFFYQVFEKSSLQWIRKYKEARQAKRELLEKDMAGSSGEKPVVLNQN